MIKYLGSKRLLIPQIIETIRRATGVETVADLFSGTARVARALKAEGFRVLANDHNAYAHCLARCYVEADEARHGKEAAAMIRELNQLPGTPGYVTETFCEKARYFQPANGARIDAIRHAIAQWKLDDVLESVLLTSLLEAADRVDSTTGVQMAYLKSWAPRSYNTLELRLPSLLPRSEHGGGQAHRLEALDAAMALDADLTYLDPPYNQHSYLGNYHVWESIVLWDHADTYGIAEKRVDCRTRKSDFNSKVRSKRALESVLRRVKSHYLLLSFNNEGFIPQEDLQAHLETLGSVEVVEQSYRRYVGAQIGIYNPSGKKVGRTGHLHNKEYLFLVRRG